MESIGVLMTCPMYTYLEHQLEANFNLIKLWLHQPSELLLHQPSELLLLQSQVRAIVGNTKFGAPSELIEALPNLEIVATFSVGLDKIDLEKCKEREIRVANTPDVLTDDVADLAIGLALCVLRRVCVGDGFVKGGKWVCGGEPQLGSKFSGRSVGILGLGRIGTAIARRAEAFGCPISYHSRSQKPHVNYKYYTTPIDLAKNCQILIVACALTEETRHIVNREVIDALGPKGVLINVGRGAHVDEDELVSALLEGRLGGAGLDVYASEPEVPSQLLELDNVVLLPHVGSDTVETSNAMADLVVANLQAHFSNRPLLTPVL